MQYKTKPTKNQQMFDRKSSLEKDLLQSCLKHYIVFHIGTSGAFLVLCTTQAIKLHVLLWWHVCPTCHIIKCTLFEKKSSY